MKTIELTIPTSAQAKVANLVSKASKHIAGICVAFSAPYNKIYEHRIIDGVHDLFNAKMTKQVHSVVDMTLTLPEVNGWFLKAEYEYGVPHITDLSTPLEIKVAGHGETYSKCDACGHKAWAKSYLIENAETGKELQVGSECLKAFQVTQLAFVHKLTRSLYEAIDIRPDERTTSPDGHPMWCYGHDPEATRSVKVATCIKAAKLYYDANGGAWQRGYWEEAGGRSRYVASRSKAELQDLIAQVKPESVKDEYVADVIKFVENDIKPNAVRPVSEYDDSFDWNMCATLLNHYCSIAECSFAFFAVKRYEQKQAQKNLATISKGQHIHVSGIVIAHKTYDGYYGLEHTYIVKAASGHTIKRNGKIKTTIGNDGVERTEFYAEVEYTHRDGTLGIGRAVTRPKKGIEYVVL